MAKNTKKEILKELEELALKVGIKVRYEKTEARGGMCTFQGNPLIIIDRKAGDDYKIAVIAENIKKKDLTDIYISPKMRELLDSFD